MLVYDCNSWSMAEKIFSVDFLNKVYVHAENTFPHCVKHIL